MGQKAILTGVNLDNRHFDRSMNELIGLAEACEIEPVGAITQKLEKENLATYIGPGKIPEVQAAVEAAGADLVLFNDELSPSQIRNLEGSLNTEIMDRTALILKIFSTRAKTREAKLQVEIANLHYTLPRLIGLRQSLEQQAGGVGTRNRGAGEKMLELNRRQIQTRIARLNEELEKLVLQRQTQRRQRNKTGIPVVSLVGYTNAGKSSIMNRILESNDQPQEKFVLEKDQLFATLETSVRSITLPDNKSFLLTDTVGFISKLPHHLVKAFRSTLEEVSEADLLIHVVDSSDPDCEEQIAVTTETLRELGAGQIPTIYAFNKSDLTDIRPAARDDNSIYLSAKNKTGLDDLMALIRKKIFEDYIRCEMLIPYHRGEVLSYLNQNAHIFSSSYEADGTRLLVECRTRDFNRFHDFVTDQK